MTAKPNHPEEILAYFRKKQIITIDELVQFSNCSVPTIRRRLKAWKTYTSYNQNGRYYVLAEMPKFDQYGLWRLKGIFFSQQGNLKKTLIHLIDQSQAGYSMLETNQILGIATDRFLSEYFKKHAFLAREKYQGVYIYFSKRAALYRRQKREREKIVQTLAKRELPSDAESVLILAEWIKHPNDTLEQLTRRVRRRGVSLSIKKVRHLLIDHDLLKKTLDFRLFEPSGLTWII